MLLLLVLILTLHKFSIKAMLMALLIRQELGEVSEMGEAQGVHETGGIQEQDNKAAKFSKKIEEARAKVKVDLEAMLASATLFCNADSMLSASPIDKQTLRFYAVPKSLPSIRLFDTVGLERTDTSISPILGHSQLDGRGVCSICNRRLSQSCYLDSSKCYSGFKSSCRAFLDWRWVPNEWNLSSWAAASKMDISKPEAHCGDHKLSNEHSRLPQRGRIVRSEPWLDG